MIPDLVSMPRHKYTSIAVRRFAMIAASDFNHCLCW